jgi:hypothetical protein
MAAEDCERLVRITSEYFVIICGSVDCRQRNNVAPTCFYLCAVPSLVHHLGPSCRRAPHFMYATLLPSAAGRGLVVAFITRVVGSNGRDGSPQIRYCPVTARTPSHQPILESWLKALGAERLRTRRTPTWQPWSRRPT